MNKINAASLIALRSAQDTNKLLVALAEQQAVAAKRTRDAEARAINQHIRFMTEGKAVLTAQAAGASARDARLADAVEGAMPPSTMNDLFASLTQLMTEHAGLFEPWGSACSGRLP